MKIKTLFIIILIQVMFAQHASADSGNKKIIIIGASYAESWELTDINGAMVVNKGHGGEETTDLVARFQSDVIEQNPDVVIIWGFINDIFRSEPDKLDARLKNTKNNIIEMIMLAEQAGVQVVLATEVTMSIQTDFIGSVLLFINRLRGRDSYQHYINSYVMLTNQWLRKIASQRDIVVLDFEQVLIGEGGFRKSVFAQPDNSHLSKKAYQELTRYVNQAGI